MFGVPGREAQSSRIRTGAEALSRLEQLGFTPPTIVRDAVQHGAGTARSVTPWHPVGYGGIRMWAETVSALAEHGRRCDWEHEAVKGVDLVTNHRTGVAVIVTAGDAATGLEDYRPDARYERPEMVQAIVNGTLDTLWDAEHGRADWQVWLLLHNVAANQGDVPAELSLPAAIGDGGHVTGWVERLLIPADDDRDGNRRTMDAPAVPPAPVVTVRRRAN